MEINTLLVSVVIPNFNGARYIEATIKSVLNQTYYNLEIIIIDNNSTDNSVDLIKNIILTDSRIKLIPLECNSGGPAVPRNVGIKASTGAYIAFVDSDDIWHSQKISIQVDIMKRYGVSFIACEKIDFFNEFEVSKCRNQSIESNPTLVKISFDELLKKNILSTSSIVVDKNLLDIFFFNEKKMYIAIEDYELWLRIHEQIYCSFLIKTPLLYYRKSDQSLTPSMAKVFVKKIMLFSAYKFINSSGLFFKAALIFKYSFRVLYYFIINKVKLLK
jgi:teichuronic acid biosynthesis glycosyltransferase TuaG